MSIRDWFRPSPIVATAMSAPDSLVSPWATENHLERMVVADLYPERTELPVTREYAMKVPAIAKGHRIITATIARCPLVVRNGTKPVDSSLFRQLTENTPNSVVIAAMLDGLIFHGRVFLLVADVGADGYPRRVRVVPEGKAETKDGMLVQAFGKPVKPGEWTRIDSLTEGILNNGTQIIRDAYELRQSASEAGTTPTPTVVLTAEDPTISQEELDDLQKRWVAARRRRHGSAAALSPGVTATFAPQPNGDALQAGQNTAAVDCARLLGLPAWSVDAAVDGGSLTYSNSASRMRELVEFGLSPYITALEDGLSALVPSTQTVKVDTSELVNSDRAARYSDYQVGLELGILTIPEIREMEGMAPLAEDPAPSTDPAPPADPAPKDESR